MRKGIYYSFLPGETPEEKFTAAKKYGFDCVEIPTLDTDDVRKRYLDAANAASIKIPSIMNSAHWQYPLSDPSADVRAKSVEGMYKSLETAAVVGADTVLLVPAVVKPGVTYERAWERSQREISLMLPDFASKGVCIACENVWNKFLLSPIDFVRYIDEFNSRWAAAYFDVGNIVMYGIPEQWIVSLGQRLRKVHIKGFDYATRSWCSLLAGSIDWKAVTTAFKLVGYDDVITAELKGEGETDDERAASISADMDKILAL